MYQANVYSALSGRTTKRAFDTFDKAAGNLAVLLRENGYQATREEIVEQLRTGARIANGMHQYWVSERP